MKLTDYTKINQRKLRRGMMLFVHVGTEGTEPRLDTDGDPLHTCFSLKNKKMAEANGWKMLTATTNPVGVKKQRARSKKANPKVENTIKE